MYIKTCWRCKTYYKLLNTCGLLLHKKHENTYIQPFSVFFYLFSNSKLKSSLKSTVFFNPILLIFPVLLTQKATGKMH